MSIAAPVEVFKEGFGNDGGGVMGPVQELAGREVQEETEYRRWLEQKHPKLVCGQEMTNAMAVFELVLR
ncbi:hypothetical protein VE01_09107 [Pseudogymnoascus verrucosus]|uniref:Uncharacterized protein n=1 Tax=Pseudogymnoascus verrucosus TaxID=342668 RepID=A0A1B8GAI7_9PEZI|nr:uncharacterized protein VE01_09107 [Pseudogymnoascus verrucosus]OBT92838.1 hypothetical protein VE01_09107 [Pseudogymnoascus verrucosus]